MKYNFQQIGLLNKKVIKPEILECHCYQQGVNCQEMEARQCLLLTPYKTYAVNLHAKFKYESLQQDGTL